MLFVKELTLFNKQQNFGLEQIESCFNVLFVFDREENIVGKKEEYTGLTEFSPFPMMF